MQWNPGARFFPESTKNFRVTALDYEDSLGALLDDPYQRETAARCAEVGSLALV
jgi:hypothetical protein